MTITLTTRTGPRQYDSGTLTRPQITALRGLTLATWVSAFLTHADRTLKTGRPGPWHCAIEDRDGIVHAFRLNTDGTVRQATATRARVTPG